MVVRETNSVPCIGFKQLAYTPHCQEVEQLLPSYVLVSRLLPHFALSSRSLAGDPDNFRPSIKPLGQEPLKQ